MFCPHGDWSDYQPYYDDDGYICYPTKEEAEYPQGLCEGYAEAVRAPVWPVEAEFRAAQIKKGSGQVQSVRGRRTVGQGADRIYQVETTLVEGKEDAAFASMAITVELTSGSWSTVEATMS